MNGLDDLQRFRVELADHVATVMIAAPPVNAQDRRFREECIRIFDVLGAETEVRAIVLAGSWPSPVAMPGTTAWSGRRSTA